MSDEKKTTEKVEVPKASASSVAQAKAAVEKNGPAKGEVKYRLKNGVKEIQHPRGFTILNDDLQGVNAHHFIAAIQGQDAKGKTKNWFATHIEEYR